MLKNSWRWSGCDFDVRCFTCFSLQRWHLVREFFSLAHRLNRATSTGCVHPLCVALSSSLRAPPVRCHTQRTPVARPQHGKSSLHGTDNVDLLASFLQFLCQASFERIPWSLVVPSKTKHALRRCLLLSFTVQVGRLSGELSRSGVAQFARTPDSGLRMQHAASEERKASTREIFHVSCPDVPFLIHGIRPARFFSRALANAATWTGWVHPLCPPHVRCLTQRTPLSLPPWEEQRTGDGQRRLVDVFSPTFCYESFEEDSEKALRCLGALPPHRSFTAKARERHLAPMSGAVVHGASRPLACCELSRSVVSKCPGVCDVLPRREDTVGSDHSCRSHHCC